MGTFGGLRGTAVFWFWGVLYRVLMRLVFTIMLVASAMTTAHAEEWVGATRCKTCHAAQHAQWLKTPHARAHHVLDAGQRRDRRCTACHSTAAQRGLHGVQCESCHGAGGHYWPAAVMQDRNLARAVGLKRGLEEAICNRCHTPDVPTTVPFDYSKALPKVRHDSGQSR